MPILPSAGRSRASSSWRWPNEKSSRLNRMAASTPSLRSDGGFSPCSCAWPAGSTGRLGCQGFSSLDTPAGSRRIRSRPLRARGSLLSDVLFYSNKSGVNDGAASPNFSAAALLGKIGSPACEPRSAVLDPSLQQSGRSPSSTKEIRP
ncbi:hypothetical protein IE4771_PE00273 (plasmid) [Rhizobium etli bv. mimosae str. IE4771]|uniref:Uncharacterized protein n=1 Tax=Rhizobium etli bv. mimosae str. IE4771 TaxID=1432050 RepID=A0A060ICP3_RHIET|nr:hypothetical protein IE4771_PE00273 [Rhizobium sp. IE4771]